MTSEGKEDLPGARSWERTIHARPAINIQVASTSVTACPLKDFSRDKMRPEKSLKMIFFVFF